MEKIFGKAKMIKAPGKITAFSLYDPLPVFRREFILPKSVNSAIITVVSPSFACYYINGKAITDDLFISPISNYCKLMWYNRYDVTSLLNEGVNTVSVIAGNGFFNEPFATAWDYDTSPWRDLPQFALSLCADGQEILFSDESWRVSKEVSPIIYSHLRSGEHYDARITTEWMNCGYDDSDWDTPKVKEIDKSVRFLETKCQPVREVETLYPVSIVKTDGGYLVDFGKNMSGYIEITVKEERGKEILFRYCEEIDDKLRPKYAYVFYHESLPDEKVGRYNMMETRFYPDSPFHLNKLITSGGEDTFKPRFSYHGFRYVEIQGLTSAPDSDSIKAHFVHQDVKRTAEFSSGDEILNFIYTAGIRSTQSNTFWSLTDCPTREKLGWTNDAASTCEQILINFDVKPLFEKWFEDLKVDMREDGSLPGIIPSNGWGDDWGPVCDSLLFELPYRTYLYTGDKEILTGAIPYFERYIRFLSEKRAKNHEFILGDWLGYDSSPLTPKEFVRDFYLIKALRTTVFAHKLNGSDCAELQRLQKRVESEFIDEYNLPDGEPVVCSQTALAMSICFELYKDKEKVARRLIERVEKDGFTLTSGMVGVQYLYNALSQCGRPGYAFKMITCSEPGYKTWFNHGATTLWECWDGIEKGSHNHHMFSGVIAWFFTSLLGINLDTNKPAYEVITLAPCFVKEVGYAQGRVETPYGTLETKWRYENGEFIYEVNLPSGITAYYEGKRLLSGKNIFSVKSE